MRSSIESMLRSRSDVHWYIYLERLDGPPEATPSEPFRSPILSAVLREWGDALLRRAEA